MYAQLLRLALLATQEFVASFSQSAGQYAAKDAFNVTGASPVEKEILQELKQIKHLLSSEIYDRLPDRGMTVESKNHFTNRVLNDIAASSIGFDEKLISKVYSYAPLLVAVAQHVPDVIRRTLLVPDALLISTKLKQKGKGVTSSTVANSILVTYGSTDYIAEIKRCLTRYAAQGVTPEIKYALTAPQLNNLNELVLQCLAPLTMPQHLNQMVTPESMSTFHKIWSEEKNVQQSIDVDHVLNRLDKLSQQLRPLLTSNLRKQVEELINKLMPKFQSTFATRGQLYFQIIERCIEFCSFRYDPEVIFKQFNKLNLSVTKVDLGASTELIAWPSLLGQDELNINLQNKIYATH